MSYKLFECYGIELEYMIVEKDSLKIMPLSHTLLGDENGNILGDKEKGLITWSNELSSHVIELKTTKPVKDLIGIESEFCTNIKEINSLLIDLGAMLLPTAAHPLMVPAKEGGLWEYEGHEIYDCYKRLFNVNSHGWLNLQSTHINLPFSDDLEFGRLHAAVRCLLPFMPALSASSPLLEGKFTGYKDARLKQYLGHQLKLPGSMGQVIPEACFTKEQYDETIFKPLRSEITQLKASDFLKAEFLNARGAIARFERGSIEIRLLDITECPAVDLALSSFIIELLKHLVFEKSIKYKSQMAFDTVDLRSQLDSVIVEGLEAKTSLRTLAKEITGKECKDVRSFWYESLNMLTSSLNASQVKYIEFIIESGNLADRIARRIGEAASSARIVEVYKELADCLNENKTFY